MDGLPPLTLRHDLAGVQLYHGDARNLDAIPGGSVHLIVTSPPYYSARPEYATWPTYAAYLEDMAAAWAEAARVLCDGGRLACVIPFGYGRPGNGGFRLIGPDMARALGEAGLTPRACFMWDKGPAGLSTAWGSYLSPSDPSARDNYEMILVYHKGPARRPGPQTIDKDTFLAATAGVWRIPPAPKGWHPAPYPREIPRRLIELYSYPGGDTVLDPFCGSGTTVFEAARLGRRGLGVDLCAAYLDRAMEEGAAILAPRLC